MFKYIASLFMVATLCLTTSITAIPAGDISVEEYEVVVFESEPPVADIIEIEIEKIPEEEIPENFLEELPLTQEEIELLALITMAEAEAEPEEGQRLVIDTILNRMDSDHFPDTAHDVIYQKNQFTSMWNGRTDRCYIREDLVELVKEELRNRTNNEVIFFRTGRYSDYGEPMFLVGHHYFSKY